MDMKGYYAKLGNGKYYEVIGFKRGVFSRRRRWINLKDMITGEEFDARLDYVASYIPPLPEEWYFDMVSPYFGRNFINHTIELFPYLREDIKRNSDHAFIIKNKSSSLIRVGGKLCMAVYSPDAQPISLEQLKIYFNYLTKKQSTVMKKEPIAYKLIKDYPGAYVSPGCTYHDAANFNICKAYPEFWEPVFKKEPVLIQISVTGLTLQVMSKNETTVNGLVHKREFWESAKTIINYGGDVILHRNPICAIYLKLEDVLDVIKAMDSFKD